VGIPGALVTLAAVWGTGRALWRGAPPSETLAVAAGAPVLSLVIFLLLTVHLAYPLTFGLVLAAGCAGLLKYRPKLPALPRIGWFELPIILFAALYLLHALAPEIQPDGATYHLGLPKTWLREAGFPAQIGFYEIMPLGLETLYAAAMALGGNPKLLSLAFLLLTLPLIRMLGVEGNAARLASVLYFCAPVVGACGSSSYTDGTLVFFTLAAIVLASRGYPAAAGLAAGFCYAIKFSGAIVLLPVLGLILWLRRFTGAALAAAAACAGILPWMLRAYVLTGDPIAPLGNALFPNASFHLLSEVQLAEFMRSYHGTPWREMPWSLTVDGGKLQGLFGPVFLLAPLALLSLFRGRRRLLLPLAALLALPWLGNKGARFLMPASVPLALGLASVLPGQVLLPAALLHGFLSWPDVVERYGNRWAWRLRETPWKVALGLESHAEYLGRTLWEYHVAQKFRPWLKPGEPVLDMMGLPYYYLDTLPVGSMPSTLVDNLVRTLVFAEVNVRNPYVAMDARFPLMFLRRVRIRNAPSIQEITIVRDGQRVPPSPQWSFEAWPNPFDGPLALDANLATAWKPWAPPHEGQFLDLVFDRPVPADGLLVAFPRDERSSQTEIYIQSLSRRWQRVAAGLPDDNFPARSVRLAAQAYLKHCGIKYLVIPSGDEGHGPTGRAMDADPLSWNLERVASIDGVLLFRVP